MIIKIINNTLFSKKFLNLILFTFILSLCVNLIQNIYEKENFGIENNNLPLKKKN